MNLCIDSNIVTRYYYPNFSKQPNTGTTNMRKLTAYLIAPLMAKNGFRFSKDFRNAESGPKRWTYKCVDVITANFLADDLK